MRGQIPVDVEQPFTDLVHFAVKDKELMWVFLRFLEKHIARVPELYFQRIMQSIPGHDVSDPDFNYPPMRGNIWFACCEKLLYVLGSEMQLGLEDKHANLTDARALDDFKLTASAVRCLYSIVYQKHLEEQYHSQLLSDDIYSNRTVYVPLPDLSAQWQKEMYQRYCLLVLRSIKGFAALHFTNLNWHSIPPVRRSMTRCINWAFHTFKRFGDDSDDNEIREMWSQHIPPLVTTILHEERRAASNIDSLYSTDMRGLDAVAKWLKVPQTLGPDNNDAGGEV